MFLFILKTALSLILHACQTRALLLFQTKKPIMKALGCAAVFVFIPFLSVCSSRSLSLYFCMSSLFVSLLYLSFLFLLLCIFLSVLFLPPLSSCFLSLLLVLTLLLLSFGQLGPTVRAPTVALHNFLQHCVQQIGSRKMVPGQQKRATAKQTCICCQIVVWQI